VASAAWVVAAFGYVWPSPMSSRCRGIVFDLWLAAVGSTGLAEGWRSGRLVRANAGLLALASLATRPLLRRRRQLPPARPLGFIGPGVAFLVTNCCLVRRARR
jgi:hypothetical protein